MHPMGGPPRHPPPTQAPTKKLTEADVKPVRGGAAKGAGQAKHLSKIPVKMLADAAKKLMKYNKASPEDKHARFAPSNFKFEIDNLPSSRLSKVDAFTVKQSTKEHDTSIKLTKRLGIENK